MNLKFLQVDKAERARMAKKHIEEMEIDYAQSINASVLNTKIYDIETFNWSVPEILLEDIDSTSAILKYAEGKTAVLNFASYCNPGGMFLTGSKAQEECLCHESFLYNVLSKFQKQYYDWNRQHTNKSMYCHRALYSPEILFQRGNKSKICDVITCAAPNKDSGQKYHSIHDNMNYRVLRTRIKLIFKIASKQGVDTLILGAFGCGVFGQDPYEVGKIFIRELMDHDYGLEKVIFAIPKGKDENYAAFEAVFKTEGGDIWKEIEDTCEE